MNFALIWLVALVAGHGHSDSDSYENWSSQEAMYLDLGERSEIEEIFWTASDDGVTTEVNGIADEYVAIWYNDEANFEWQMTTSSESDTTSAEEWDDASEMEDTSLWSDLDPEEEAVSASDGELEIDVALGSSVYIAMTGVDSDGECELEGFYVENKYVDIVGYAGPYTNDDSLNTCGVLITIEPEMNDTDDEIEVTFVDGEDAEVVVTITVLENDETETTESDDSDDSDSYLEMNLIGYIDVAVDSDGSVEEDDYYGAYVYQIPTNAQINRVYTTTGLITTEDNEDYEMTAEVTIKGSINYLRLMFGIAFGGLLIWRLINLII